MSEKVIDNHHAGRFLKARPVHAEGREGMRGKERHKQETDRPPHSRERTHQSLKSKRKISDRRTRRLAKPDDFFTLLERKAQYAGGTVSRTLYQRVCMSRRGGEN